MSMLAVVCMGFVFGLLVMTVVSLYKHILKVMNEGF